MGHFAITISRPGVVSGDYCDVIAGPKDDLYFVMADVSGKGVAAAMLSSNLRAVMRSLVPLGLSTEELMTRASSIFRQSLLPMQYATVVCGRATVDGEIEIVNAGHLPALLGHSSGVTVFESTSQPLGLFDDQKFLAAKEKLQPGETLVLYTDGVSEAENDGGEEYGIERLQRLIDAHCAGCPVELIDKCKQNLAQFRGGRERADDETLLALQFTPADDAERDGVRRSAPNLDCHPEQSVRASDFAIRIFCESRGRAVEGSAVCLRRQGTVTREDPQMLRRA